MTTMHKSRWWLPLFSLCLGLLCLTAFWLGDNPGLGLWSLGVMTAAGAIFLFGGRFEMIRGLRGDARDEYWSRMDVHASYLSGLAIIGVIIGMCLWEWGHGRDGSPYVALGAVAGVSYIAALAFLRWRS